MSAMDNLRQAAKELFGLGNGEQPGGPSAAPSMEGYIKDAQQAAAPPVDRYEDPGAGFEPAPAEQGFAPNEPAQDNLFTPPQELSVFEPRKDTSIIAKGTTIVGRVRTDGHMEILGRVEGNIEAEGDIAVQGRVSGNVRGNYLGLYGCQVKGNLTANSGVVINTDSIVVGDVQTESIIVDGKLKGNINAKQMAILKSNAYLLGDLTAQSISIETGAVVNGMVTTTTGYGEDSPFDAL